MRVSRALSISSAFLFVSVAGLAGCTSLLGDFDVTDDQGDAGEDSGALVDGGHPGDSKAPDAGVDAKTPADGSPDLDTSIPDTSVFDAPPPVCNTCIPALPTGWTGPVAYVIGTSIPSSCDPAAYGTEAFSANAQLTPEPATCSSCAASPTGQYCDVVADLSYKDVNGVYQCSNPGTTNYDLTSHGPCAALLGGALTLHPPVTKGGVCNAPAQNATVPKPNWAQSARACTLRPAGDGTCSAGQTCVQGPQTPFGAQACVYTQGDVACPKGYDSGYRGVVYEGALDSRGCSACTSTYADQGCTGTVIGNTNVSCAGTQQGVLTWGGNWTATSGVSCYGAGNAVSLNMSVVSPRCNAGGGQPIGTVLPDTNRALTVCCM